MGAIIRVAAIRRSEREDPQRSLGGNKSEAGACARERCVDDRDRFTGGSSRSDRPPPPPREGKRWLLRGKALAIAWESVGNFGRAFAWLVVGWSLRECLALVLRWSLVSVMIRFCNFDRRDT